MKQNKKTNKVLDSYKSGIEVRTDLERLEQIKNTINDIMKRMEICEAKTQSEISILKDKIYQLTSKETYINDKESQELVKQICSRISGKEELFQKRNIILLNQLEQFKNIYNKMYSKEIVVRCKDLKEELEKNVPEIYINLSIGIISYEHIKISSIINEYKDENIYIDMAISDKKNPEYCIELNNILYVKRFQVEFNDEQYDNRTLANHLILSYGISDEARRYTNLKIDDTSFINLKFKLGELTKENSDWKPVKLIREAVCNCKDKEYKRNNTKKKIKKI